MPITTQSGEADSGPTDNDRDFIEIFKGDDGLWGIADSRGGIYYEADFCRVTAEAIVDMMMAERPPKDWEETKERLDRAGLPY